MSAVWIILVIVVVLLISVRAFVLGWINVSGISMVPTLYEGELTLVSKLESSSNKLKHGDTVVVKYPNATAV